MCYIYWVKNMATEKELQDEMERLRAEVQGLVTDLENAKYGLKAFGKAGVQGAVDLTKGLGSLALTVGRGDTSFKSLNSVVDIAANALAGMAKAIPFAGAALAAVTKATAEASKFMLDQMDTTIKAFNDLGRVGALTERGMSGLQKQFLASNLSFGAFNKQVTENAQALARFKGMAGDGVDAFAGITGALADLSKGSDDSLRRLGMSTDDIGASTAAFITQQTRLGLAQGLSNAQLAAGTKAYAIELDALQKVTGLSREAIQKQQDAALSESRFRANYDELIAQGKEAEAKALMKLQTQISAIGPQAGQGIRDLLSGAGTDAAAKLMASTGGAAQDILDRVKEGKLDETRAAQELQAAMKKTADAARNNARYVDQGTSAFIDYSQQSDLINAQLVNGQLVKQRQDKQMAEGTDGLTDSTVAAEKAIQSMNIGIQQLGFTFLPAAATAVKKMTESIDEFVKFVNKQLGIKDTPESESLSESERAQQARAEQAQVAQNAPAGQTNKVSETLVTNTAGGAAMVHRGRRVDVPVIAGSADARAQAEQYLGQKINDQDFSNLLKATHAEAAGGKQASQQEQAMIMATILNRARTNPKGIEGALYAKNQFQSVTGTSANNYQPSQQFLTGPKGDRLKSIEGAAALLSGISQKQTRFTAADPAAYGPGTNIGYRNLMLARGGTTIGGTVFNTSGLSGPTPKYESTVAAVQPSEQLASKPAASAQSSTSSGTDVAMLRESLAKQDEMISLLRTQLATQQKQLQLSN
jgi:hypothetical protein